MSEQIQHLVSKDTSGTRCNTNTGGTNVTVVQLGSMIRGVNLKRLLAIASFYLINFGLWELLKGYIGPEWDSFLVYVILFPLIIAIFWKEIRMEGVFFYTEN